MTKRKSAGAKSVGAKPAPRLRAKKSAASAPVALGGSLYAVHPGVAMVQKWIGELPAKTGRSLGQWVTLIKKLGPKIEKDCRDWLKCEHKLGTNTAWWLAEKALGNPLDLSQDSPEGYLKLAPIYVEQMYADPKEHLRPIHDELVSLARELGADVRVCPCKTMVPVYRNHVFAEIKPATQKRIDLGLALGEEPFTSRLLDTGGRAKKDRITHKVAISSPDDIDLQVRRWLKQAYERDG
jgi:Domain of unknown function (DUF5655)/Domain of unknown function (DUF4287)